MLVYCEIFDDMENAIMREKQLKGGSRAKQLKGGSRAKQLKGGSRAKKLKGGSRAKKLKLIESMNPNWNDLYNDIIG